MNGATAFAGFSGPDGRPTEAERGLIEAASSGSICDCAALADDERTVSGALIAALAARRFAHPDYPGWSLCHHAGFGLANATISGTLGLAGEAFDARWFFVRCVFEQGIDLSRARLRGGIRFDECHIRGDCSLYGAQLTESFTASGTTFDNSGGYALNACGLRADGCSLQRCSFKGLVDIREAELSGELAADNADFDNPGAVALCANGARTASWSVREARFKGIVDLDRAHVTGNLVVDGSTFENPGSWALTGAVHVAGFWSMFGVTVKGQTVINKSAIAERLQANRASFDNPGGPAILAHGLRATDVYLREASVRGQTQFDGSRLEGPLVADGAQFDHEGGEALTAVGLKANGLFLERATVRGALQLKGSVIAGAFVADEARFEHAGAIAIDASFCEITGGVFIRGRARVDGAIDLAAASICKVVEFSEVELHGSDDLAVNFEQARVSGTVVFRDTTVHGCVSCSGMRVDGRIDLRGARISATSIERAKGKPFAHHLQEPVADAAGDPSHYVNHAVILREARIDGRLTLPEACPSGIVDLSRASCDTLEDTSTGWPPPLPKKADACESRVCVSSSAGKFEDVQHVVLDGFEYRYFDNPSGRRDGAKDVAGARIDWLAGQSVEELREHFNPQPWKQAAAVLRSMGYDEDAQALSIERRVRQRLARSTPFRRRIISWLLHKTADYGFNPWKTVGISVAVILVFAGLYSMGVRACDGYGVWSSTPGACGQAPPFAAVRYGDIRPGIAEHAYPAFNSVTYSLDIFVPVLDLGAESYWHANTRAGLPGKSFDRPVGWLLYVGVVIERFLGAILIAIAITGFTGLLTRDEK